MKIGHFHLCLTLEMRRNLKNIEEAGELVSFFRKGDVMKVVEWWQKREKEKKQKKLLTAAQKLEAKADPSLPKKRLPKNGAVK